MLADPPVTIHQGRAVIVRRMDPDRTDACRKAARRAVLCRITYVNGVAVDGVWQDLVYRVTATKRHNGRWVLTGG
jgi:hypothetical protein